MISVITFQCLLVKKVITHACKQIPMTSYYKVGNHSEVNIIKPYDKLRNESWNAMLMKPMIISSILSQHYIMNISPLGMCNNKILSKPWMTKQLINACKKEKLLYVKFLTNRTNYCECRYKKYKNKY